jgi:hypothetical protein
VKLFFLQLPTKNKLMTAIEILSGVCVILLSLVSFFLIAFYNKVDTIAKDLNTLLISVAVKDEKIETLEKRVTTVEKHLKIA